MQDVRSDDELFNSGFSGVMIQSHSNEYKKTSTNITYMTPRCDWLKNFIGARCGWFSGKMPKSEKGSLEKKPLNGFSKKQLFSPLALTYVVSIWLITCGVPKELLLVCIYVASSMWRKQIWIIAPIYSLGWISSITLLSTLQTTCQRESSPQHSVYLIDLETISSLPSHQILRTWLTWSYSRVSETSTRCSVRAPGSTCVFFHLNRSADTAPTHRLRRSRDEIVVASRPQMIGG